MADWGIIRRPGDRIIGRPIRGKQQAEAAMRTRMALRTPKEVADGVLYYIQQVQAQRPRRQIGGRRSLCGPR
jgi:hypothetical protein